MEAPDDEKDEESDGDVDEVAEDNFEEEVSDKRGSVSLPFDSVIGNEDFNGKVADDNDEDDRDGSIKLIPE